MKKAAFLGITSAALLLFTACANTGSSDSASDSASNEASHNYSINNGENGFITVSHISGETSVPLNPQRVVVFDMGILDTLDALGLSEQIIGLPQGSHAIPSHLQHFNAPTRFNAGSLAQPNLELIVAQDPDLIIISGRARPMFDELSQIAPTLDLGLVNEDLFGSFIHNSTVLGQIFGLESEVAEHLSDIEAQVSEITALTQDMEYRALVILFNEGSLRAFGPGGRFGLIHETLGVPAVDNNIEVSTHGYIISNEYIVATNPDIIFVIDRNSVVLSGGAPNAHQDIENELVQLTRAYTSGNVFYLDSSLWYVAVGGLQGTRIQISEIHDAILSALK